MTQQKKYLAIAGGVLAAGVIGWLALSHVATNRAEEQITAALDRHGLRDKVQWKSLSASPLGTVHMKGVTVQLTPKGDATRIARITLTDFVDDADHKRADVRLTDIAGANGFSPLGDAGFMAAAGRADLPPLALHLKWDMRLDDDEGQFDMAVDQPEAFKGNVNLQLEQIAGFARLSQEGGRGQRGPQGLGSLAARGGFGLGSVFGVMEMLGSVKLRALHADVEDDGYVARSVALYKRYAVAVAPDGGSLSAQRAKGFEQQVAANLDICRKQPPEMLQGLPDREDACETVMDFVSGESSSLRIDMEPSQAISLSSLMEAAMTNPARFMALLNAKVDS